MANLVDRLLKADAKKADERITGTFKSHSLARLLGDSEPVEVTIQEISGRRQSELLDGTTDADGGVDLPKAYDANLKIIVAGVIDPPLKDKEVQSHFGCHMAIDLADKLFKGEVGELSDAILKLGKVGDVSDDEEEIKN